MLKKENKIFVAVSFNARTRLKMLSKPWVGAGVVLLSSDMAHTTYEVPFFSQLVLAFLLM